MTIALTGTGGLFTRLGVIGGMLNNLNGFIAATAPNPGSAWGSGGPTIRAIGTNVDNIAAQFQSTNQQLVDGLYTQRDSFRSTPSSMRSYLRTLAENVLIKMADDDVKLVTKDKATAMAEVIKQMIAGGASVPAPTVSASVAVGSANLGNGSAAASVIGPNGINRHYLFAEVIDLLAITDSQGSGTLGREGFSLKGDAQQSDQLSWDWPLGSAANTTLNAVDATEDASTNKLTNGDFEDITSNSPTSWDVSGATPGTDLFEATGSNCFAGSKGIEFRGTGGGPNTAIFQALSGMKPLTVYAFNLWMKKSASTTGIVSFQLTDGSGTVINDAAGTANTTTKDLSTLTTSFASFSGFFRTPALLPSAVRLRLRASTALNSGQSAYMDHLALAECTEAYSGGPFVRVFSGANKFILNDSFAVTVANNYGSAWQKLLERLFGMRAMGLQVPTSGSPTIADSLIA